MKTMGLPQRLEKSVEISTLCAFYGELLTDKQREALQMHYDEDLSLGEIAEQLGVSRQNVHELITRSAQKLRRYEDALGAAKNTNDLLRCLEQANDILHRVKDDVSSPKTRQDINEAIGLIDQTILRQEGEENEHGI